MPADDPFGASVPELRRAARERVVELLYEAEMKDESPLDVLESLPIVPDDLVVELVGGIVEHVSELDTEIDASLHGWAPERVAVLDRIVLRLGIYELRYRKGVPTGAVLDEAVALAKRYSGPKQGRFVNGVLAKVAKVAR